MDTSKEQKRQGKHHETPVSSTYSTYETSNYTIKVKHIIAASGWNSVVSAKTKTEE